MLVCVLNNKLSSQDLGLGYFYVSYLGQIYHDLKQFNNSPVETEVAIDWL